MCLAIGIYSVFLTFSSVRYTQVCTNSLYYFMQDIKPENLLQLYAILQSHNSFKEAKKLSQFY